MILGYIIGVIVVMAVYALCVWDAVRRDLDLLSGAGLLRFVGRFVGLAIAAMVIAAAAMEALP